MSRSPRIALKDEAARGLKAWAALEGREPAAILEELVMVALPARVRDMLRYKPMSPVTSKPTTDLAEIAEIAEKVATVTTLAPKPELPISTTAMMYLDEISRELMADHEPTLAELAARFRVPAQSITKALSPLGIRAQETKRSGKPGRYFTTAMKGQIEDILR